MVARMAPPLRGRLTVGRLALDQVVKVRILAPQPQEVAATAAFRSPGRLRPRLAFGVRARWCPIRSSDQGVHPGACVALALHLSRRPRAPVARTQSSGLSTLRCLACAGGRNRLLLRPNSVMWSSETKRTDGPHRPSARPLAPSSTDAIPRLGMVRFGLRPDLTGEGPGEDNRALAKERHAFRH